MCAISGMIGLPASAETIQKMLSTMRRRGPDGSGVFRDENVTLLHSRLAIIDPEGGKQPMEMTWAGEDLCLVYNGELYNTQELRYDLQTLGHQFQGHSDTEVVLHAYAQYGMECVHKFNGIFAFAVWEKKRKRLFLARDRIGVKPLFYCEHGDGLIFASEMKTLFAYPSLRPKLDQSGIAQVLLLGPGRMPGSGVFRDIRELEPGCCGYYEAGTLDITRYWRLTDREHRESFEETAECVRYLVRDAIERQMVSDVPIGTFLSGGLDSSIITGICAKQMQSRGARLHTFSVDYVNNDIFFVANKFQPNSDNTYIRLMQEAFETQHHWSVLCPEDLVGCLEAATIARDLPGMADVDFSLLAFCREIRFDVKVALSGECADEIFGGYPWYRDPEVRSKEGFPWAQNTVQRGKLLSPGIKLDPYGYVMEAYNQTCAQCDILPGTSDLERRMKEMVNLNFRWFMQTLLDRKDRMSMYSGLEVRVPFCDYRIAEYLYGVPWTFKDYQNKEKGLLRYAVRDLLPEEVLYRKKSPYPKTFDPKYEQLISERLDKILLDANAPVWYMMDRNAVMSMLEEASPWPWYGQLMRTPQLKAYLCQIDFWLRHYDVEFTDF